MHSYVFPLQAQEEFRAVLRRLLIALFETV